MNFSRLAAAAIPATVVGCLGTEPRVGPPAVVEVRSDRVQYGPGDTVHAAMVNLGSEPVYVSWWSLLVRLERDKGGQWEDLGTWYYTLDAGGGLVAIQPGDSLIAPDLRLGGSPLYGNAGRYRLVYREIYQGPAPYRPLPESLLASNAFDVTAQEVP